MSGDVDAAWEALYTDVATSELDPDDIIHSHRSRIEAAIRADETRDCQSRADSAYERGRAESAGTLDPRLREAIVGVIGTQYSGTGPPTKATQRARAQAVAILAAEYARLAEADRGA